MIVEFFGLPGVGKSTFVDKLTKTKEVVTVPKYSTSRLYAVLFCVCYPLFSLTFFYYLLNETLRSNTWSLFRFKLSLYLNTCSQYMYARKLSKTQKFVLLDEGILQRLFTLFESERSTVFFKSIIRKIPLSDCVIILSCEDKIVLDGRVGTMRRKLGNEYSLQWKKVMTYNYKKMEEVVSSANIPTLSYHREINQNFDLIVIKNDLQSLNDS